jgi:hypothetical protein
VSENIKNRGFLKAEPVLLVERVKFPLGLQGTKTPNGIFEF